MSSITVAVACHKPCTPPADELYLPVQAGRALHDEIGFTPDNTGDNISEKNPFYCELTVLYWANKNLDSDYIGLSHYRRHFSADKKNPLTLSQAEKLIGNADVVLPKKRKYYIENLYDHYKHTLYVEPLDEAGRIISERCPEYSAEFERLKKRTSAHMFNMLIMRHDLLESYCEWLFGILGELESRIPPQKYEAFHARYPGRIAELLLDVWICTNGIKYTETGFIDAEGTSMFKKGIAFLKAKFKSEKYGSSF